MVAIPPNTSAAPATKPSERWARIPQELRERSQWCVADQNKAPRTPNESLPLAKSNDQTTWRTFDEACAYAAHHDLHIGYMLHESDPFTCIDMDVKDDTPIEQVQRFNRIVKTFDSYTERSRSGRGLHVWVKGKVGEGRKRDGVEVYSRLRFMICTGDILHQKPIEHRHELLEVLAAELGHSEAAQPLADGPEVENDEAILLRAASTVNGAKFQALFSGNWQVIGHSDHSKADMSLIQILSYYSRNNDQVKRLFLSSALGQRDKATKRLDYFDRTLAQARAHQANEPNAAHGEQVAAAIITNALKKAASSRAAKASVSRKLRLVHANEIGSRPPMKWLVRGVLPEKGIGAIFGPPGSGKSFLVLDLLAAIAEGFRWFGIPSKVVPVIYISLEGQAGIPQRIRAYRAKRGPLERIIFIEQPIDLRQPENLQQLISLIGDAGLSGGIVCIDTLAASAPGIDENASTDMGKLIAAVQELQVELDCFVLLVHHTGKDASRGLRGWSGLNGALDCAIETSRVSEEKENRQRKWEVTKSKDGQDGRSADFMLEEVELGIDEEGYSITSCVIGYTVEEFVPMTELDANIDNFILAWVKTEVDKGNRPSGRSLDAQRSQMASEMRLSQTHLRQSIARLEAEGRLVKEKHNGNSWLRAVESANPH